MMQSSHKFCPLCSIELYESQIAILSSQEITLETLPITEETLNFLLNPVPLANPLFQNSENEIKVRRLQSEIYGGSLMKKNLQYYQPPYGWDFFIFGLRFLQINQQKSAGLHFEMFLKIRRIVQPNEKCNSVNYMDAEEINFLYDQLMENFKVFYMNLNDNNLGIIQKFILKFYEDLIEMLELIQLQITPQTKQLLLHKTDTFYKIQLQIAILCNYNNQKYIYTQFYQKYLQNSKTIVLIGMILVKDYERAQSLWSIFFKSLNEKQQYSHIDSILGIFDSNNQKCQLNDQINLIKIAKEIKKSNQYWLSLMIFSFFRKIYKKQKDSSVHLSYLPFVYVQLAKLSLYLCTLDEALKLYQTAYDKFLEAKTQNIQIYCPNHNANTFQIKILSRIFLLKLYLNKNQVLQTAKILQSLDIPYHLNEFINFVLDYLNHCNLNSFALKRYEAFFQRAVFQICSVQNQKIIPKKDMIERSNVIELVNKNIPKFQLKKKSSMYGSLLEIIAPSNQSQEFQINTSNQFEFTRNQNILFNSLMIYYLITANISQDHLDINEYNRQWNIIEICLQYIDTSMYKMLVPILQHLDQNSHFKFYENLLISRIHCYICEFELSKQYLQKFNLNLTIWKENKKQCGTHIKLFKESSDQISEICTYQHTEEDDIYQKKSSKLYKSVTQSFQQNKYYCESIYSQSKKSSFISTSGSKTTDQIDYQFAKSMSIEESTQRTMSYGFEGQRKGFQCLREFLRQYGNLDLLLQWDLIMQKQHLFKQLETSLFLKSIQIKRNLSTTQQSNVVLIELFDEELVMKKIDICCKIFDEKEIEKIQMIFSEIQILLRLLEIKENDQFLKLLYLQFQICQNEFFSFTFYLVFPYYPISIQRNSFGQPQKVHFTRELLKQVAILHRNKILHLDLKPSNILINDGNPMIIDYGSAQLVGNKRLIQITQRYCAPEVLNGNITPKADIYSLGCIIYELFTEQRPEISEKAFNLDLIRSLPDEGIQNIIALATKPIENRGDLEQLLEIF